MSKLPRWIEYGAFILALVAGCINAIALMGFEHQSVSHVTGSATSLGTSLYYFSTSTITQLFAILIAFFVGACISGFMLSGTALKLGRHYDSALFLEAAFLLCAYFLLSEGSFWGSIFASIACGLQNALATSYSGAIIRTTHLTGIFTDLGIMLGAALRGEVFEKRKAILWGLIIGGFIGGAYVGALLFDYFAFKAILLPCAICFLLAMVYRKYQQAALLIN